MTIATTSSGRRRSPLRHIPAVGLALAVIAALLLVLGPLGWRAHWWSFRIAFLYLLPYSAYFGIAALIVSALALLFGRAALAPRGIAIGLVALIAGGLIAYVPWHYGQLRGKYPPIDDIATDTANPPAFLAAVPLRQAEHANPTTYQGAKIADQQKRAYPDIAPLIVALPPDQAFAQALATARHMGWTILASDPASGRIEASDRSRWFGFTDDIVIRIAASGPGGQTGSRIDMRSSSRWGRGDFGVNAGRIRTYMAALRKAVGGAG